jgi:hypothetical protein
MPYLYHVGILSSLQSSVLLFTLVFVYGTAKTRNRYLQAKLNNIKYKRDMKIFISYAHSEEDSKIALRLYNELKKYEVEPWLDSECIPAGCEWKIEINEAIQQSNFFIAILSFNSVDKKGYVQKELREAISKLDEYPPNSIFIIPVRINPCDPKHPKLKELQWVDMFDDWTKGFEKIISSLRITNSIFFKDKRLASLIRIRINKMDGIITEKDIENIYELNLQSEELIDITGIEKFSSLLKLDISNNSIQDINPLVILSEKIKQGNQKHQKPIFNLNYNPLSKKALEEDIHVIKNNGIEIESIQIVTKKLADIVRSILGFNQDQKIYIDDLLKIKELILGCNTKAEDLWGINTFKNLEKLIFDGHRVTHSLLDNSIIKEISHNNNLLELSIVLDDYYFDASFGVKLGTINDLSPLSKLSKLKSLIINCQEISDIKPIKNLYALEVLNFNCNIISNIEDIANLTQLKYLILGKNQINDISPIEGLKNLIELDLDGNYCYDLDPSPIFNLFEKGSLKTVYIRCNSISENIRHEWKEKGLNIFYSRGRGWDYSS